MDTLLKSNAHTPNGFSAAPTSTRKAVTAGLRDVVYALSDALDFVGVNDIGHGKRVGIMAAACGRMQGVPESNVTFLFDLGMLHDIGVSSTRTHQHLVEEFDWEDSQAHCEEGYIRLRDFVPLQKLALPVLYHHTRWERLDKLGNVDPRVAMQANLVFLADRVDAMAAPYYADRTLLMHAPSIREHIKQHAGSYFAPELVAVFLAASASEAFWLQLEPRGIQAFMQDMLESHESYNASVLELRQLGEIFSQIVDAKSPFTAEHSLGVARLARYIARNMGVSAENCDKIEIAGLLHDLGKLRIPDEILDKSGKLDEQERRIINSHSFETFQILRNIKGFEEIAMWAAHHHEEPDGSGYPFHVRNLDLPIEARILRIADIFQAMVQDRPYRKGLSSDAVVDFLNDLVAKGRLESEIVTACTADMRSAMAAALPITGRH